MLHAFFGTDVVEVRERAHTFLNTYEEEGYDIVHVTPDSYMEGMLAELAGSAPLFTEAQAILLDTPSEKREFFDEVMDDLAVLSESNNIFVLIEGGLAALQKKQLQKYAQTFEDITAPKGERFNIFSLADALLRRDKKSLWVLLIQARSGGFSNEEVLGALLWQVKVLRLAEKARSAEEAGQKPFVYSKAKRALTKFTGGEPGILSRQLLTIYHEGHLGKRDIEVALERWVLEL